MLYYIILYYVILYYIIYVIYFFTHSLMFSFLFYGLIY